MVWFEEPERFNAEELAALVKQETGGELHPAIRRAGVWRDREERELAEKRLAETLARYAQRPQNVDDPALVDIAELLTAPPEARYGRISYPQAGVHYDVFAAGNSWFGLIAVTEDDDIHVRTLRREYLADAIVAAMREHVWKSDEQPIQITRDELEAADEVVSGFREPPRTIARVHQLMGLKPYLSCEFYAEYQHRGKPRRQSRRPLMVYGLGDELYDVGCWTLRITPRGSDREIHLAPADIDDVAVRIEQLRRELD